MNFYGSQCRQDKSYCNALPGDLTFNTQCRADPVNSFERRNRYKRYDRKTGRILKFTALRTSQPTASGPLFTVKDGGKSIEKGVFGSLEAAAFTWTAFKSTTIILLDKKIGTGCFVMGNQHLLVLLNSYVGISNNIQKAFF